MIPIVLGNFLKGDSLVWKGPYSPTQAYVPLEAVEFEGSSYICIASHMGQPVSNTEYWDLMAKKGSDGSVLGATIEQGNKADTAVQPDILATALALKVDKVSGKQLSTEDYTTAEKAKLASLSTSSDSGLSGRIDALEASVPNKVDKVAGKQLSANDYTSLEKTKLGGIADGATLNSSDALLRDRTTHTGSQAISTVTGLQAALDAKVAVVAGKVLSTNDYTTAEKALVSTSIQPAGLTKAAVGLGNVDNTSDASKPISAATQTALNLKVDVVAGKGLSTNDYTTAEKTKLAGLDSPMFRGVFLSLAALTSGITSPVAGNYADVDSGTGTDAQRYIWDVNDSKWVLSSTNTATTLTAAQVKTLYESNADTNAYTTAEKTKLSGIATGATVNSPDATLLNRANHTGTQAISTVANLQTTLDAKVAIVAGKQLSTEDYTTAEKIKLAGVATGATANATDALLRDRTTHTGTQAISTVTGLQTALDSKVASAVGKQLSTEDYTTAEKTKLAGIATGATANSPDATLLNRANHTGTQAITTVDGLQTALDAKVNVVAGKQLSTEDFTTAYRTKLDGLTNGGGGTGSYTDVQAAAAGLLALKRVDLSLYGDATTNAATKLQEIINAGNIAYIPAGKTVLVNDATITLNSSTPRCHIVNDGSLVYSKTSRCLLVDQPFGTPVTASAISDVTYNSESMTRITLSSVTGLGIGNIVKVYCDSKYPWVDPNGDSPYIAETVKICAVDTTNNYIYVPLLVWTSSYTTATTLRVAQQFEYQFSITGLGSIGGDGDPDAVTYNSALEAIRIQGVVDPIIYHRLKDAWGSGIRMESTYQGRITLDLSGQKNDVTATPKVYGYGVHYGRGCTGGIIDVQARDGRHPFTTDFDDSGTAFASAAIKDFGGPMFPKITGSAVGTRGCAFDSHAFVGFATYYNCKVTGVRVTPTGSGTSGINNRGYATHIFNSDVRNCAIGINDDSYGQNTGKKFSTLIQGGSISNCTYGIKAGGVQLINAVLTPELNSRLTIRDIKFSDMTQGVQLDLSGASVNLINNQFEKIADVSVGIITDAVVRERGRVEDRSQFGTLRDGATGNGMYKVTGGTGGATTLTTIQLYDSYVFGSTSRPTGYITGSSAPAIGTLRVGGNRFPDRTSGLASVSSATVATYIDDDSPAAFRTTSTAYTFATLDAKRTIEFNSTSATTATVPLDLDVPVGTVFFGVRANTGALTIAGATGVTINKASATATVASQYGEFTLTKTDPNVYRLSGALS